jgi:hypothetical protein
MNTKKDTIKMTHKFATIKMAAIEKRITAHFNSKNALALEAGIKTRPATQAKMKDQMIEVIQLIIAPQITEHYNLNLSDKELFDVLGIKASRADQLREELRAAGIIVMKRRSKKLGEYPLYLVEKAFINYPSFEKKEPAGPYTSKTYNQAYCDLYDQAKAKLITELRETGSGFDDGKSFKIAVYAILNENIARMNLTKVDFLK